MNQVTAMRIGEFVVVARDFHDNLFGDFGKVSHTLRIFGEHRGIARYYTVQNGHLFVYLKLKFLLLYRTYKCRKKAQFNKMLHEYLICVNTKENQSQEVFNGNSPITIYDYISTISKLCG